MHRQQPLQRHRAKAEAKVEAKKEAPKVQEFKGDFVSADAKAKTLVAKDDKGEVTFNVAKKIAKFAAGDKIVVKYTEKDGKKVASSVKKAPAEKKAEAKKDAPAADTCTGTRTSKEVRDKRDKQMGRWQHLPIFILLFSAKSKCCLCKLPHS